MKNQLFPPTCFLCRCCILPLKILDFHKLPCEHVHIMYLYIMPLPLLSSAFLLCFISKEQYGRSSLL